MSSSNSFKWKRKRNLSTEPSSLFSSEQDSDEVVEDSCHVLVPKKMVMLEDNEMASQRLQRQGVVLASSERYIHTPVSHEIVCVCVHTDTGRHSSIGMRLCPSHLIQPYYTR